MTIVLHGPADAPFWVTAIAPTATETQRLRDDLGYDADSLAHAFDRAERPRLRILSGERTFLVVRGPLAQTGDIPFSTTPISFLFEARRGLTVLLDDSPLASDWRLSPPRSRLQDTRTGSSSRASRPSQRRS